MAFFAWTLRKPLSSGTYHVFDTKTGVLASWPHRGLDLVAQCERTPLLCKPERAVWLGNRLAIVARAVTDASAAPQFNIHWYTRPEDPLKPPHPDWYLLDSKGTSRLLTRGFGKVSPMAVGATGERLFILADDDLWQLTPDGARKNLSAHLDGELSLAIDRGGFDVDPLYTGRAALVIRSGDTPSFVLVDLRARDPFKLLNAPSPYARVMSAIASAGAVFFREDSDAGSRLMIRAASGAETTVDRLNTHLAEVEVPQWQVLNYTSSADGRAMSGCMLLPTDYRKDRRYPVIVEVYPSMVGTRCTNPRARSQTSVSGDALIDITFKNQLLAAQGYVFFYASSPSDLQKTQSGPIANMQGPVLDGVDALISQGYADPDRIGLYGRSQGGASSLWLATQTDRFKAVVSIVGWADYFSHYFQSSVVRAFYHADHQILEQSGRYESEDGDFSLGKQATPWSDPEAYIRNSPIAHADKITAPILLVHSDMDAFALSQTEEMFTALYRLGKEARFLTYWGEGHIFASPANLRHVWGAATEWFDRYLDVQRDWEGGMVWEGAADTAVSIQELQETFVALRRLGKPVQ